MTLEVGELGGIYRSLTGHIIKRDGGNIRLEDGDLIQGLLQVDLIVFLLGIERTDGLGRLGVVEVVCLPSPPLPIPGGSPGLFGGPYRHVR